MNPGEARDVELHLQLDQEARRLRVDLRTVGASVDQVLRRNAPLNTRCGGRGLCDGCLVELVEGVVQRNRDGQQVAADSEGQPLRIRACEHSLTGSGPVTLRVPRRSQLAYAPQVVSDFRVNVSLGDQPLWQQLQQAPATTAATAEDKLPVFDEGLCSLARSGAGDSQALLQRLAFLGDRWSTRIVTHRCVGTRAIGIAVDVGTTTVAVLAVDLASKQVIGRASGFNQQMGDGDDVVTRINRCMLEADMVARFQDSVTRGTIAPLIEQALQEAQVQLGDVRCIVLAGNTVMQHLLAGADPSAMGVAPFEPQFLETRVESAVGLGLVAAQATTACSDCQPLACLLPSAAAYLGADVVAGVIATGMHYDKRTSLLVDVGTNGEIVLAHQGRLWGCATAAGPAFEGSRLAAGVRAGQGAISHVRIDSQTGALELEVIGKAQPHGICGSAYVDLLAQARAAGWLNAAGRWQAPEPATPGDATPSQAQLARRLSRLDRCGNAFRVAWAPGRQPLWVTDVDLAQLLQAKAAVAAGMLMLLEHAGISPAEVDTLFLAGGFGLHLNIENAIAAGLLPGFSPQQVQLVGNTSLAGAYMVLLDASVVAEMDRVRRQIQVVELNLDPRFEDCYLDQLSLPPACVAAGDPAA